MFSKLDHCAIFLLIAGTYTPLSLCSLREYAPWLGWTIFGVIWGMAAFGITLNAIDLRRYRVLSMVSYLGMGWCIILGIKPLMAVLSAPAISLLVSGGITYTIGAVLYRALEAAKILEEKYGVSAEVIDARSIVPFNYEKVIESVKKTGKILIVRVFSSN